MLVDCHVFDGKGQGTTTYLKGIYSELVQDENILFYLISFNPDILKSIFGHRENVIYLKYPSKNKFKRLLFDIPSIIKKHAIDFAHFQYISPPIKTCKYIVTIHDVLFLDYPKFFPLAYRIKNKILFYFSAKKADYVLTVSDYSKERIKYHFNIQDVQVSPNAVDSAYFETYNKKEIQKIVFEKYSIKNYFLFVSRREPRKNHLNLLKSFVINGYFKKYQLVFIGTKDIQDPAFEKYFYDLSTEIKATVVFLEKVTFEELLYLTRAASISVYPSFAEGFGIPPLESIAANIPTICSNKTAMSEFDFLKYYLFDPNSIDDISLKIDFALSRFSVEEEIIAQVKSKYSWIISAKVLSNIFKNN